MRCQMATATARRREGNKGAEQHQQEVSAALKPTSPCLRAMLWRMAMTEVGIV